MSPRYYLIPLVIVAAGAAWLVERQSNGAKGSISVEIPRIEADWCREGAPSRGGFYCEVREFTFTPSGEVGLDASPNGGIEVQGDEGSEIRVQARVSGRARNDEDAYRIVSAVRLNLDAGLEVSGPKTGRRESWAVSYRAHVPWQVDLALRAMNGSIAVEDVSGDLELTTVNGGITLGQVSGAVSARTVNGGIKAQLTGTTWEGSGLELRTTNGTIDLGIPPEYNAALEAATTNGGVQVDFPVTVTGRIGRRLNTVLGDGGPTISATTTNGSVKIRKRQRG